MDSDLNLLISSAKIRLNKNSRLDCVPEKKFVKYKLNNTNYYVTNILHTSPTLNFKENLGYLPLLICDIVNRGIFKSAREIYHNECFKLERENIVFYKNFPVKNVSILGKILNIEMKEFVHKNVQKNYYLIHVNDSSSKENLIVKMDKKTSMLNSVSGNLEVGIVIKVYGKIKFRSDNDDNDNNTGSDSEIIKEVDCENFQIINNNTLSIEIDWWILTMKIRHKLLSCWEFNGEKIDFWYSKTADGKRVDVTERMEIDDEIQEIGDIQEEFSVLKSIERRETVEETSDIEIVNETSGVEIISIHSDDDDTDIESNIISIDDYQQNMLIPDTKMLEIKVLNFLIGKTEISYDEIYTNYNITTILNGLILSQFYKYNNGIMDDNRIKENWNQLNIINSKKLLLTCVLKKFNKSNYLTFNENDNSVLLPKLEVINQFIIKEVNSSENSNTINLRKLLKKLNNELNCKLNTDQANIFIHKAIKCGFISTGNWEYSKNDKSWKIV